ncbi:MAG: hypothetical protein AYP45_15055 [Candidatus Brocadia carolinensis]|uniref:Uncharacterized protein n=1 Tax=Candidatus Brocadia carolinensis TaxID=1004156 RepID=A0A1V4AQH5_9BACT|nr:MAG: hypothetical protein AYP45_15055 [Candidatus Brocadia caroliniensis]
MRNSQAAKPVNSRGFANRAALQVVLKFYSCNIMGFPAIHAQGESFFVRIAKVGLTGGKKDTTGDHQVGNIFPVTGVLIMWFIREAA